MEQCLDGWFPCASNCAASDAVTSPRSRLMLYALSVCGGVALAITVCATVVWYSRRWWTARAFRGTVLQALIDHFESLVDGRQSVVQELLWSDTQGRQMTAMQRKRQVNQIGIYDAEIGAVRRKFDAVTRASISQCLAWAREEKAASVKIEKSPYTLGGVHGNWLATFIKDEAPPSRLTDMIGDEPVIDEWHSDDEPPPRTQSSRCEPVVETSDEEVDMDRLAAAGNESVLTHPAVQSVQKSNTSNTQQLNPGDSTLRSDPPVVPEVKLRQRKLAGSGGTT